MRKSAWLLGTTISIDISIGSRGPNDLAPSSISGADSGTITRSRPGSTTHVQQEGRCLSLLQSPKWEEPTYPGALQSPGHARATLLHLGLIGGRHLLIHPLTLKGPDCRDAKVDWKLQELDQCIEILWSLALARDEGQSFITDLPFRDHIILEPLPKHFKMP